MLLLQSVNCGSHGQLSELWSVCMRTLVTLPCVISCVNSSHHDNMSETRHKSHQHTVNITNDVSSLARIKINPKKREKGSRQLHHPKSSSLGDPSLLIKIYLLSYHLSSYDIVCVCVRQKLFSSCLSSSHTAYIQWKFAQKRGIIDDGRYEEFKGFFNEKKKGLTFSFFQSFFFSHWWKLFFFCVTFRQSIWE